MTMPPQLATISKHRVFQALAILLSIILLESVLLGILWYRWCAAFGVSSELVDALTIPAGNLIRQAYPEVNFSLIYPGQSSEEIDSIQREAFALPYRFEAFTGFCITPTNGRTVTVTDAGFRVGAGARPWPPSPTMINVFVFGGSTTFGSGVAGRDTLPASLEQELHKAYPGVRFVCYNFGCGYYFSTQERLRLEQLLALGHIPQLAIFVDGLNDFYAAHGLPEFSSRLARAFPSSEPLKLPTISSTENAEAVCENMLGRYRAHVRMVIALMEAWNFQLLIVGQPVPFFEFHRTPTTYPFPLPTRQHPFAAIGYNRFRQRAVSGEFGAHFLWCGDAFEAAQKAMYADSIHYSPEGNRVLARVIVERAKARGLLKF